MSPEWIGIASVAVLVLLIWGGMHVSTVMMVVSFFGALAVRGDFHQASRMLGIAAFDSISDYEFGVIPLFVFMGLLVMVAGLGSDSYRVAHQLFRRIPGSLGHATVGGNAIFAAITGVSVASATVFTRLAVPEMLSRGYDKRFAVGVVAGSSVLGMLIPPSVLMILFGILTEASIGDLFIAGVVPGLLLAAAYGVMIWVRAARNPQRFGGTHPPATPMGPLELARRLAPVVLLIVAVLGGIYGGVFTATEAGGVGAFLALLVAFALRKLDLGSTRQLLVETGHVTASLVLLIVAANMYTRFIAMTGLPSLMAQWIGQADLGLWTLVACYLAVLLVLGTLMDSASIMLITIPLVLPAFVALQMDLVWIGIVTVIVVEIGLLTPPFGMAAFVVKSTLQDDSISLTDIFMGALPFAAVMLAVALAILAWPPLATGLLHLGAK
jgi:C4-dicarboxylate transporter, DctM subunit